MSIVIWSALMVSAPAAPFRIESGVERARVGFLARWSKAVARGRRGGRPAVIVAIGNSKTANNTGLREESWPSALARHLTRSGLPAASDSWWGNANVGGGRGLRQSSLSGYQAYDPRVTMSGPQDWTVAPHASGGPGGAMILSARPGATLTFQVAAAVDRCELWFAGALASGMMTASLNGGPTTTLDARRAKPFLLRTTISARSSAAGILSVRSTTTRPVTLIGERCWDSTASRIQVLNWGWGASTSTDHANTSQPWTPVHALAAVRPDLTLIALDTNDYTPAYGPVPLRTYRRNLQRLVATAKRTGDCIIMTEPPSAPDRQAYAVQNAYHVEERDVASRNGCGFVDVAKRWGGDYETMATRGWYIDTTHGTAAAYEDEGRFVADMLLGWTRRPIAR